MPQFDFSTYSSQIFWLLICFSVFYYFVSKKILPRITEILQERKRSVEGNINKSNALNKDSSGIKAESETLKKKSIESYKSQIENLKQELVLDKEKEVAALKAEIESMNKNSREQIKRSIDSSKEIFEESVTNISVAINSKLLSK